MSYVEKTIQVTGFTIAMKIWNADCSNPILCLHGKMDNAANQGVPFPQDIFRNRAQYFQNLTIYEVQGGHHVHMDNPIPVANLISRFLG